MLTEPITEEKRKLHETRILAELARRSLSSFCEYAGEGAWVHAPHLDLLCEKIEEAEQWVREGHDTYKLITVSMPPRHGKSEVVSRHAPAWILGRNPDWEIIEASHTASLATDMSREARRIFKEYAAPLFGLELSRETQSVELWHVAGSKGKVQAAGAGGPIMGRGAHFAIVDDPHKSLEEAESPTYQHKVLQWMKSTLISRMAPGGAIILVASRLHIKDLIGQLRAEAETSGIVWDHVVFSATAQEEQDDKGKGTGRVVKDAVGRKKIGAALWKWRFNEKQLAQIRALQANDRLWQAMYEQNPTADVAGALWKLGLIDALRMGEGQVPQLYKTIISWDPSATSKKTSDAHGIYVISTGVPFYAPGDESIIGELDTFHGYIRDNLSGIYTPDNAVKALLEVYDRYNAVLILGETNQGGDWLEAALRLRRPTVNYHGIPANESKIGRAEPVSALYQHRRVHHVGNFPQLEKEQTTYTGPPMPSPNELDAVVHGLAYLFDLAKKGKKKVRVMGGVR